jgi:hypothetical protein
MCQESRNMSAQLTDDSEQFHHFFPHFFRAAIALKKSINHRQLFRAIDHAYKYTHSMGRPRVGTIIGLKERGYILLSQVSKKKIKYEPFKL